MLNKYYTMKEVGTLGEKTFQNSSQRVIGLVYGRAKQMIIDIINDKRGGGKDCSLGNRMNN